MFKKLLDSLEILIFFFPWSSLLKETLRTQLHLKGKGVPDTREKGNCVLLNDFFYYYYHSGNQKKSDYGYHITLRQKKKIFRSIFNEKERKKKKKFTQVLFYAHNSICFSNTSICSWFLNLAFELNTQEP